MRILFSLLFLFFANTVHAAPDANAKQLIILGDSLVEGFGVSRELAFPALLQKKIDKSGKNWRVVNAGISGSTTASAPSRVQWHLKQKPGLILIVLGGNDGLRGSPVKNIIENLEKAIDVCTKAGVKVVLAGMKMPPNYGEAYRAEFEAAYKTVAEKKNIPLLPFILDKVGGDPKLNLIDGIHPNEKGHAVVAQTVYDFLQKYL